MSDKASVFKPTASWHEEDGIIYFSISTDNTVGEKWIIRLESKSFSVGHYAKSVLRSRRFNPTPGGVALEIAVLTPALFAGDNWTLKEVFESATERNFTVPNADVACLIREKFADEEIKAMGLWHILTMHEPIADVDGEPSRLLVSRQSSRGGLILSRDRSASGVNRWPRDYGFAFVRA